MAYQDKHTSSFFAYIVTSRWLRFTLELLADLYTSVVLLYFFFTSNSKAEIREWITIRHFVCTFSLPGSSAFGLAMSSSMTLTLSVVVSFANMAEVINQLVSAERVLEYVHLTPEAPLKVEYKLDPNWPKSGNIQMNGVVVAYKNGPNVLKDIQLNINSGEKVNNINN